MTSKKNAVGNMFFDLQRNNIESKSQYQKKSNAQQVFFLMTHKINLYSDYIKIIKANLC